MKDQNLATNPTHRSGRPAVLNYLGYDDDRGGIVSVIRALETVGRFACTLGVNPGFSQQRVPPLPVLELPAMAGESIGWRAFWRARKVAVRVRQWLREDSARIFHGHSRAGLVVALWLHWLGEQRVVVSVHCYGRQRWFYRWVARWLGKRIFWLTPAMKQYYGVGARTWEDCIPNSLPGAPRPGRKTLRQPGHLVVGGVGLLIPWKGWHCMIEALALLPAEIRARVEFRHIGMADETRESAAYARELVRLAEQRGVTARISWLGWQPSSAPLLKEIDCLLVASDHEPFSMAALEALFAGVPVLAADSGGPTDFIAAGRNGWFFTTGNAADLARKLALLAQGDAFARLEITAEELQRFTSPAVAEQWERVYAKLTATGKA